jgi:hypothetical protein
MPRPPVRRVEPLGEYLLHPLHDLRQFQPVLRPDVKGKPVILKLQPPDLEHEPKFRLSKHGGKDGQGLIPAEQGFPVIDTGTDFVPNSLCEYT